jgi:hypothetical protein
MRRGKCSTHAQALAARLPTDYLSTGTWRLSILAANEGSLCDLPPKYCHEVEDNMQSIPRKQRMVRKGIKAGLQSDVDEDIDRFFMPTGERIVWDAVFP